MVDLKETYIKYHLKTNFRNGGQMKVVNLKY